jgi:hypothetical protein
MFCGLAMPEGKIGFRDICTECGKDLHICKHCKFYSPGSFHDCLESVPESIFEKERMNFCDLFKPDPLRFSLKTGAEKSHLAKQNFNKLFGD